MLSLLQALALTTKKRLGHILNIAMRAHPNLSYTQYVILEHIHETSNKMLRLDPPLDPNGASSTSSGSHGAATVVVATTSLCRVLTDSDRVATISEGFRYLLEKELLMTAVLT